MIELGERRLQLQGIPVNNPDPVPKRSWVKGKTHGRANTRGLTANELGQRRQRQQGRQQAQEARIQEEDFIQQLHQAAASQDPFDSQFTTISVAPARSEQLLDRASERPRTPPQISQTLPIRTPTTTERPRRRKTPSPEPSPEPSPLPTSAYELPTSTAPPKLGREKRKRVHTCWHYSLPFHTNLALLPLLHQRLQPCPLLVKPRHTELANHGHSVDAQPAAE